MNDRTRLPQGYEPHELPPDYTGKLWIEGQMRAYADAEKMHWKFFAVKHFDLWTEKSRENATLREQVRVLRAALIYHQDQTRPVEKTRAALEATK